MCHQTSLNSVIAGNHPEQHLHLGLACIARRIWAFVVHQHLSIPVHRALERYKSHGNAEKTLQCLLCTLHLSISNCIQHFERLKHEDHFPYLHIGCGAYKPPAPYPVLASSEETYGIGLSTSFW